jgi:pimeloyl-ACP methyl ester carboxylesterase
MTETRHDTRGALARLDEHRREAKTRRGIVSYLDTGPRGGVPAVFVHGVGTNAFLWRNVIAALEDGKRCVAIDLPLHGQTPEPADGDVRLSALADTIDAFIAALDAGPVDLVANDTGGALSQIVTARNPDAIRSLTLTNCEAHDNVPPEVFKPTVDLAKAGALAPGAGALLADLEAARTAVFATGYEDPQHLDLEVVDAFLRPVLGTPDRARGFERMLAALEPSALLAVEPALRELRVPTLVVWGTGDPFFELRWAQWLRDTIPSVTKVVEIENARLFFPDERAADLVPHLDAHWQAVARAA